MNPSDKGWLRTFISYRSRTIHLVRNQEIQALMSGSQNSFEFLYQLIQPTGLMYGFPIKFIGSPHPKLPEWKEKDKIKVLLAESYLCFGQFFHGQNLRTPDYRPVLEDIYSFYQQHEGLFIRPGKTLFRRKASIVDDLERILDKRISIQYDWRNFWTSFFHNSLLFLDLILFVHWKEHPPEHPTQALKTQQQLMRVNILRVIAAAAHAEDDVKPEERELFNYFLQSAHLPAPLKRKAATFIRDGVNLSEIDTVEGDSWIMNKYYLELAILTTWANRNISEAERVFLRKLAHQLDLTMWDLDHSMKSVKLFVQTHWNQVHYLQIKQNYRIVSEQMIREFQLLVKKNQRMIGEEISQSKELVVLLRKSTRTGLTEREKEKVRRQLLDILRTIPTFTLALLPGAFITLPILMRVIPKHILFPSSFVENLPEEKPSSKPSKK
ncbi:hypothetical protein [Pontibacter sp. G13]|uniref:hypothetical protein n=1 Tax=Pontibacter sp. G13 TaxID=3074898 RepID=UPI00288964A9|nr:hypothetical protein [Pontibacter sp. G13]WNJ19966.1 hypothetical protein RJD25_05740 [Pontibacter sp. G13]